ncbi:MAG TPA: hypothetical protein VF460_07825 [Burkholderiales bacterium]
MTREIKRPALQDVDDLFIAKERLEAKIAERRNREEALREDLQGDNFFMVHRRVGSTVHEARESGLAA